MSNPFDYLFLWILNLLNEIMALSLIIEPYRSELLM